MNLNPNAVPTFLLAAAMFWAGFWLAGRARSGITRTGLVLVATLLAFPGFLFVLYYAHLFDTAAWFYSFRALPYSEFAASGLGLLGGIIQRLAQPVTTGEKLIAPAVVAVLLFIPFMKSALDPVDYAKLQGKCDGGVCLQSTPSTCGPSSAATLLKALGHPASEQELARESFTYRGGTEIWFVARALRKRGLLTDFVIQPRDRISPRSPAIAGVVLRGGAGHFIAILSQDADEITIGDPLIGKRVVFRKDLLEAYNFTGFFLLVQQKTASSP